LPGEESWGGSIWLPPFRLLCRSGAPCGDRELAALALFYVLGSVAFSIAGLFAGLALVRHLT
jgi:hypothetical protein